MSIAPCFNVIGYITGNLGLGVVARNTLRRILSSGREAAAIDVDAGYGRSGRELEFRRLCTSPESLRSRRAVNLFFVQPRELDDLLKRFPALIGAQDTLNVCVPFWELDRMPADWPGRIAAMDAVLCPSRHVLHAARAGLGDIPTIHYPQTTRLPPGVRADRKRFGLPEDKVIFITAFEPASDVERKNPGGVIQAFVQAFDRSPAVELVVKVNNSGHPAPWSRERLAGLMGSRDNIRVVTADLTHADALSVFASCDVMVSLHRGEGLGLPLMEAMLLGKPVVATAWSGNTDFMRDENACMVPYSLVAVQAPAHSPYHANSVGSVAHWADPDLHRAAEWMRRLAGEPPLRASIGERARTEITGYFQAVEESDVFDWLEGMLALKARSAG